MDEPFRGAARPLMPHDLVEAADALRCELPALEAVLVVETGGLGGYLPPPRQLYLRCLFEAHIFSRLTEGRFDASHPDLSRPRWDRSLYVGGAGELDRVRAAMALDRAAALGAASWGFPQILGCNYRLAGYRNAEAMVRAMAASDREQLDAMLGFITMRDLAEALQAKDWATFARGYNGTAYRENRYDTRLAAAYERLTRPVDALVLGSRGPAVARLQRALNASGANPHLTEDGLFGRMTERAVEAYQAARGLAVTGVASEVVMSTLLSAA